MRTAVSAPRRGARARTAGADLARLARVAAAAKPVGFGAYRGRPIEFQREVLGYEPIEAQETVLRALQERDRVAVPSGRAMGKSRLDAGAGLHFLATEGPNALVVLIAPTFRQIQVILWEELRKLYFEAKVRFGGECAKLASTGLRLADGSRAFGITGDRPEALQGIRAPRMLVLADEASGIPDTTFAALEGNLAGGGKMLLTGNPTRSSGFFRDACRNEERFKVITLPSTKSPNVLTGQNIVPGIATLEWIEERKQEWGEDSPLYRIHVLGEFVEHEQGRLFTEAMIAAAEQRWHDEPAIGRLVIGLDPAGDKGDGDESAFAARRGKRVLQITTRRGLSAEGHVDEILSIATALEDGSRQRPLVVVDRDGYVGARVYAELNAFQATHEDMFDLTGVRGGERARRRPKEIDRVRDEVWLALVDAFRDGLAIPEDVKLSRELAEIRLDTGVTGRSKITPKDDLRRELGRSPDRADALALCVWGQEDEDDDIDDGGERGAAAPDPYEAEPERVLDPYAAMERWK